MSRDDDAQVIRPPDFLRAKVGRISVADPEAMFEAADRAIADRADGFLTHARSELAAMRAALHQAATIVDKRAESLECVYGIAHDLKGQGSSFGYQLITGVAALLCQFLRGARANDARGLRIATAHVEALSIVMEHKIAGDGGKLGATMIERLRTLVGATEG